MTKTEELRGMLATMLMLPPEQITSNTSLTSLEDSLGGARLKLGLKRLGLSLPMSSSPGTFGELEAILFQKPSAETPVSPVKKTIQTDTKPPDQMASPAGTHVGIDIQDVRSLPVAKDYWEHEFYAGLFGKSEIAYAVVQSEPRIHLAAYWCAKEALRKCDPTFMSVPFDATVVAHDADGKPYLQWRNAATPVRLPHALSLSHTNELATAVVMAVSFPAKPIDRAESMPSEPPVRPAETPVLEEVSQPPRLFLFVSFLVIAVLVALLVRHFWH